MRSQQPNAMMVYDPLTDEWAEFGVLHSVSTAGHGGGCVLGVAGHDKGFFFTGGRGYPSLLKADGTWETLPDIPRPQEERWTSDTPAERYHPDEGEQTCNCYADPYGYGDYGEEWDSEEEPDDEREEAPDRDEWERTAFEGGRLAGYTVASVEWA